jgi:hypothetical protein
MAYNLAQFLNHPQFAGAAKTFEKVRSGVLLAHEDVQSVVDTIDYLGISVESESEGLGVLVPHGRLSFWFNDESMADRLGYEDEDYKRTTDDDRLQYARTILRDVGGILDADLHPGLLALTLTDGDSEIVLGYAITGYSFSGIDVRMIGYGLTQQDLVGQLSDEYILIDREFYDAQDDTLSKARFPDDLILKHWDKI